MPLFNYAGERDIHFDWAEQKGEEGLLDYVQKNSMKSFDGLPTNLGLK